MLPRLHQPIKSRYTRDTKYEEAASSRRWSTPTWTLDITPCLKPSLMSVLRSKEQEKTTLDHAVPNRDDVRHYTNRSKTPNRIM